jgi:alcohol dehydrogenase
MMPMLFWNYGSSAEYAAVPVTLLAHKPKNISMVEAASIPLVGTTVVTGFASVLEREGTLEKKKILIQAGGGGVGSFAVQYAKHGTVVSYDLILTSRKFSVLRRLLRLVVLRKLNMFALLGQILS